MGSGVVSMSSIEPDVMKTLLYNSGIKFIMGHAAQGSKHYELDKSFLAEKIVPKEFRVDIPV